MSYLFSLLLIVWCLFFQTLLIYADGKPVINEFLPHPSTGNKEWVELYVPDGVDVTNYWIDDDTDFTNDSGSSSKKQVTSVVQGSDSHHVVFELSSSMFNNSGDTVALFTPDGTLVDQYSYASDPGEDVSIGRSPDATGDFQVLSFATHGSSNTSPKPPDTATPAPTDKPTKEPKPTETPKPKIPTVTNAALIKSDTSVLADSTVISYAKKNSNSPTKISSNSAYPTSILRVNTTPSVKKLPRLIKPQVLVKGASINVFQIVAISIGGLLLLGCGILIYLKSQNLWFWEKN